MSQQHSSDYYDDVCCADLCNLTHFDDSFLLYNIYCYIPFIIVIIIIINNNGIFYILYNKVIQINKYIYNYYY